MALGVDLVVSSLDTGTYDGRVGLNVARFYDVSSILALAGCLPTRICGRDLSHTTLAFVIRHAGLMLLVSKARG